MADKVRVGVLASGRGSNLQAIMDAADAGRLPNVEFAVVLSDNADAYALERAKKHGIAAEFVDPKAYGRREDYDGALLARLREHGVNLVLLAGYMRIVGMALVEAYPNRMINIHPALLPAFPGLHVQRKAIEYGVRFSGCTVHFVDGGMDTGPIIIQAVVPVLQDDDEDRLAARILRQEHKIYPEAVKLFSEGRLEVQGRRVLIKDRAEAPDSFIINPPIK